MNKPPLPRDEAQRLDALRHYSILDTLPEEAYNEIARLAAYVCGTPISLVTLIDTERQWFKAKVGTVAEETPRDLAFCAYAIVEPKKVMVVPDAQQDSRFADNPLVTGDPHVRFYAGAPLVTPSGHAIGTLCVLDSAPHTFSPEQQEALAALSHQVLRLLEFRRTMAAQAMVIQNLKRAEEALRRAEQEYRKIYESALAGLYETTADGLDLTDNVVLARLYGYDSPEQFIANLTDI